MGGRSVGMVRSRTKATEFSLVSFIYCIFTYGFTLYMRVCAVRKWPLRGRSRFVCWNIRRVSLWLLCNVHFVQSTQRTRLQTRPFVCGINSLLKLGVQLCKQKASGRPLTAEDDVEWVRASFLHSPKKSSSHYYHVTSLT